MQNAIEAALHDDVTKSAKRNMEALLGASMCVLLCERIHDSKDRVVAHRWRGGPRVVARTPSGNVASQPPDRPTQTAVVWLAPHDRHPACLRRYSVLDLARQRGWPRTLTKR
jgi:hypothetical protein